MSNQAETPTTTAPTTPAPAAPAKRTFADIARQFAPQPEAAPAASPAPAATPEAPAAAPTDAPAEAPRVFKHRDAAAALAAQKADREALAKKREAEAMRTELETLRQKLAAAEKNPVEALRLAKTDPLKFAEQLAKGELQLSDPEPATAALPDEVRELIEEARARREEERKAKERAELEQSRAGALDLTKRAMEAFAEEFPAAAGLGDGMANQLMLAIEREYGGVDQITEDDFKALLKAANEHVVKETRAIILKPASIKAILADEATKTALLEALGLQTGQRQDDRQPSETAGAVSGEPRTLSARATGTVSQQKRGLSYREIANMFKPTE